jgi:predicted amino acid-binding ACT domain protein
MKLWDFGRMESGRVKISPKVGEPLGLVDGSEVFSSMFKYEYGKKEAFEIVLSPFGPENYREIAYVTIQVRDEPGALAQASRFLKSLNVDILNSETVSSIPKAVMIWEMLVDLSFFGDSSSLKSEFDSAKSVQDPALSMVDCLYVETSDLATRYTRGASLDGGAVKTKALRKTEKKASIIESGSFELPQAYKNFLGKESSPVMLIGDPDSWVLSVVFLDDETKLFRLRADIPDRPGSVHEVMKVLGNESVNVVAGYTNVLVYYERMTCDLVVDLRDSRLRNVDDKEKVLKEKISGLGPQFSLVGLSPIVF